MQIFRNRENFESELNQNQLRASNYSIRAPQASSFWNSPTHLRERMHTNFLRNLDLSEILKMDFCHDCHFQLLKPFQNRTRASNYDPKPPQTSRFWNPSTQLRERMHTNFLRRNDTFSWNQDRFAYGVFSGILSVTGGNRHPMRLKTNKSSQKESVLMMSDLWRSKNQRSEPKST